MPKNPWRYIGVDWDSGAWVAVGYPATGWAESAVFDTIEDLWSEHSRPAQRIVVDVPIGLCESHDATDGCVDSGSPVDLFWEIRGLNVQRIAEGS